MTAQEGSHWGICLKLEQKWLKLFRHRDEELQHGHRQWVLTCIFGLWHMRLSAGPTWVLHGNIARNVAEISLQLLKE